MTGSLDKKLKLWDSKTRNVSPSGTITLNSDVASISICGIYILAAVERNVYLYDMRNLTRPVDEKDCPLDYQIRCLHTSLEWNGICSPLTPPHPPISFSISFTKTVLLIFLCCVSSN
jgi:cell cycle arrest protein BUB3